MKKLSISLTLIGFSIAPLGCSQSSPGKPPAATAAHMDPIEQDERAIELNAQRAKQSIDEIKAEARDALRRTRQGLKTKATKHASELSELAAEMAEEAKDRAEDIPEALDRALEERQSDLRSRIRKRLEAEEGAVDQEESDSSR
ncbi:MAG: hypothetical protein HY288_16215 [Planctomycetia bacterium]|nr:hypothetical protein [Planctomycetia bacterium]